MTSPYTAPSLPSCAVGARPSGRAFSSLASYGWRFSSTGRIA